MRIEEVFVKAPENTPEISVLMPMWNSERTVVAAVTSILEQQGCVAEILISDDCSNDQTLNSVRTLLGGYKGPHGVRLFSNQERLGIDHIITLVDLASCGLLVQAHSDDQSLPLRLARLLALHRETNAPLITSSVIWQSSRHSQAEALPKTFSPGWVPFEAIVGNANVSVLWGARYCMARQLFEKFPRLDSSYLSIGHDVLQAFRAFLLGGVWLTQEQLLRCGWHEGQWSKRLWDRSCPASDNFGFALHRLGIVKAMFRDLNYASDQGMVNRDLAENLAKSINIVISKLIDLLIASRDQMRKDGMNILWASDGDLAAANFRADAMKPKTVKSKIAAT
jgi:glycosyltransferase involved in cell wall biosynthesis